MRKTLETAINGLKLWTERLVKRSADEVRGEIPAIPTPKQADWNQNDDTAIDHIKGRTHYERIGFKQIPIGTYNDHAPGYTDYNVGPYAWDYTNGITLRVDGVVYEFETFTKSDFDSNLGCYGYWVGAPLVRGQIADSSEYPFHFRIFEKDNEYAHVEFADGTDNHTFEVFCTEIKQLDEKYIPDSIARKSDIPQGGGTSDIPDTLPNPHPLTFTGAVKATYDGSTPVTVEIPMGGGAAEGEWELIGDVTVTSDVNEIAIKTDTNGNPFELKRVYVRGIVYPTTEDGGNSGAGAKLSLSKADAIAWYAGCRHTLGVPHGSTTDKSMFQCLAETLGGRITTVMWNRSQNSQAAFQDMASNLTNVDFIPLNDNLMYSGGQEAPINAVKLGSYTKAIGAGSRIIAYGVRK